MRSLNELRDEAAARSRLAGFYDDPALTFPAAMMLLVSEVGEALDAWRDWGFEDHTPTFEPGAAGTMDAASSPPKPEGVGSELADVFIRLLVSSAKFGLPLEDSRPACFLLYQTFPDNLWYLTTLIVNAAEARVGEDEIFHFTNVLTFLRQICGKYGIDLEAETERKMKYNWTRPYKHGGRKI